MSGCRDQEEGGDLFLLSSVSFVTCFGFLILARLHEDLVPYRDLNSSLSLSCSSGKGKLPCTTYLSLPLIYSQIAR